MWIMLNDCFISLVAKDCSRDEVLVRARRPGDLEKLFPGVRVEKTTTTDYLFRAKVKRSDVSRMLAGEVERVTYPNFKNSVDDHPLHDAYMLVWTAMSRLQPTPPYDGWRSPVIAAKKRAKRTPRGSLRKGR
jgi:hypothetical protein